MEASKSSSSRKEKPSSSSSSSKHSKSSSEKKKSSSSSSKHRHRDDSLSPIPKRKYSSDEDSREEEEDDRNRKTSTNKDKSSTSNKKHRNDDKLKRSEKNEDPAASNGGSSGGGEVSLSIEETNKLRLKLGLKPLSVSDNKVTESKPASNGEQAKKTYIDKDTNQEFEHVPAKNMADIREQKELRQKLQEKREKRLLGEKYQKSKGLADSDDEENESSAAAWLQKAKEKQEAIRKAKILEEMDQQFGDTVDSHTSKSKTQKDYDSTMLKGLRVEHDQALFKEGKDIILTLKDRNILTGHGENLDVDNDEEADVLINVNIADDERFAKNVENKKNKPNYKPYDDFDDEGQFKERSILDKYNEELNGETKKSFKLDAKGTYDASDMKLIEKLDQEHKARAIRIDVLNELKLANDYMTQQELEKFKKPKKIRKVLRKSKNKMVKADDLLPLSSNIPEPKQKEIKVEKKEEQWIKSEPEVAVAKQSNDSSKISLKNIDFGFDKTESRDSESSDSDDEEEEDDIDVNKLNENEYRDFKEMLDEEANALEELQTILSRTRNKITSKVYPTSDLIESHLESQEAQSKEAGVAFEKLNTIIEYNEADKNHLTLDTMSEFCRNLGNTTTNPNENESDDDDEEENMKVDAQSEVTTKKKSREQADSDEDNMEHSDNDQNNSDNSNVINRSKLTEENDEEFELLDDEPVIDRGLASCLNLCINKGFIEKEKTKQNARFKKESIEAKNFTIEEKNYYDIDDK